jgi:phage-related protein
MLRKVASGTTIINPTMYDALPLIRVYGSGTLTIGREKIVIASNSNDYVDIDSDIMDCYC